jgi:hypothetical protein
MPNHLCVDNGSGVALRRSAGEPHMTRRPQAEQLVASSPNLEGEFTLSLELSLDRLLAVLEYRHRTLPRSNDHTVADATPN